MSALSFSCVSTGWEAMRIDFAPRVHRFQPRKYPAMHAVSVFLRVLAAITVCSLVMSLMLAWTGGIFTAMSQDDGGGAAMLMAVVVSLFLLVTHGTAIAAFTYAAESIRILLDIQQNTQQTAFYAEEQSRSE